MDPKSLMTFATKLFYLTNIHKIRMIILCIQEYLKVWNKNSLPVQDAQKKFLYVYEKFGGNVLTASLFQYPTSCIHPSENAQ